MTDREAMQQALDVLDRVMSHGSAVQEVKDILRERLAQPEQPEQEPVAWISKTGHGTYIEQSLRPEQKALTFGGKPVWTPLYTHPPRQEQPEPVACKHQWFSTGAMELGEKRCIKCGEWNHTTPPRREWVGLTDEEVKSLPQWFPSHETAAVLPLIRAIEAKLREKNT